MRGRIFVARSFISGNASEVRKNIDTFDFDTAPQPYSGVLDLEDSSNWDRATDKTVSFTQVDPLPFYLMYIDIELSGEQ